MPIYVDGGLNPAKITYNGAQLTKVVCNGTTVWERSEPPSGIEQVRIEDGGDMSAWLFDLEYQRDAMMVNADGSPHRVAAMYAGGATVYYHTKTGRAVPFTPYTSGYATVPLNAFNSSPSITGVPAGFEFGEAVFLDAPQFTFYRLTEPTGVIDFSTMHTRVAYCEARILPGGQGRLRVSTDEGDWALYAHSDEYIVTAKDGRVWVYLYYPA